MRCYDDPVEVRRGMVAGPGGPQEGPEQFLWRDRLWKVHDVLAHWVETGPWWASHGVHAVLGSEEAEGRERSGGVAVAVAQDRPGSTWTDLGAEREFWRVEASRGLAGRGVFDLVLDWSDGCWRLSRCVD